MSIEPRYESSDVPEPVPAPGDGHAHHRHRRRRHRVFAVLPTLLTLGNAACGFGSITFAAKVGPVEAVGTTELTYFWISALLIYLAMLFDALDGRAARWANQSS